MDKLRSEEIIYLEQKTIEMGFFTVTQYSNRSVILTVIPNKTLK